MSAHDLTHPSDLNKKKAAGDGPFINLSVKLFLTDIGESSVKEQERVKTMADFSGESAPAVEGKKLFARTLKEFIITSRINKIELQRVELVSKKHEITDLTKLIVYALLYRLFPQNLIRMVSEKGIIIRKLTPEEENVLQDKNDMLIGQLRQEIHKRAEYLKKDKKLSAEKTSWLRQKTINSIMKKLINMIPLEFYRVLLENPKRKEELMQGSIDLLSRYLERSKMSDYLSSAFLEWIGSAEKENLKRAFSIYLQEHKEKNGFEFPITEIDELFKEDKKYREILTSLAEQNKISLKINWKFGRTKLQSTSMEDVAVVKIRLYNKGLIGDWVRSHIETTLNQSTRGKTLGDFYDPEKNKNGSDPAIGLMFTAFLRDECHKQNIDLYIKTREDKKREETIMNLTMKINAVSI